MFESSLESAFVASGLDVVLLGPLPSPAIAIYTKQTDANQSNKNLLLSPHSLMNANPQLEIYAEDVKCSHGSTTGQIDSEALFYLRSRGIRKQKAIELIIGGFAEDILENINSNTKFI